MALNDKVLEGFFNKVKRPSLPTTQSRPLNGTPVIRYRVFDDPLRDEVKNEATINNCQKIDTSNVPVKTKELRTDIGQIKDKPRSELRTDIGQIKDKLRTGIIDFSKQSTKPRAESRTEPRTNQGHTEDKPRTNINFSSLVGLQREITIFIFENIKQSREKTTQPISIEHLSKSCKSTKLSVQKTIQRLEAKGILIRSDYKVGRGGWTKYSLHGHIYQELLHTDSYNKLRTNVGQTEDIYRTEPKTEPRTVSSSSSSKNILSTATTDDARITPAVPPEWEEIDLSELQRRGINFGKTQLISNWQFLKNHSVFEFQESIDGYVYDIDKGYVQAKTGYLNLFIGIIRKGELYISSHYVSPDRMKINEIIELRKKRKTEQESLQQAIEEEKFIQWMDNYGTENIKKQLPVSLTVDFEHRGKPSLEWIKWNIYQKLEN